MNKKAQLLIMLSMIAWVAISEASFAQETCQDFATSSGSGSSSPKKINPFKTQGELRQRACEGVLKKKKPIFL